MISHLSGGGTDATITGSTMGSVVMRYGLSLPPPESRNIVLNQYFESKSYSLVHAAPMVGVFILDHEGVPLPTPSEVANRVVPGRIEVHFKSCHRLIEESCIAFV